MKTIQLTISMPKKKYKKILRLIDAEVIKHVSCGGKKPKVKNSSKDKVDTPHSSYADAFNDAYPKLPFVLDDMKNLAITIFRLPKETSISELNNYLRQTDDEEINCKIRNYINENFKQSN